MHVCGQRPTSSMGEFHNIPLVAFSLGKAPCLVRPSSFPMLLTLPSTYRATIVHSEGQILYRARIVRSREHSIQSKDHWKQAPRLQQAPSLGRRLLLVSSGLEILSAYAPYIHTTIHYRRCPGVRRLSRLLPANPPLPRQTSTCWMARHMKRKSRWVARLHGAASK